MIGRPHTFYNPETGGESRAEGFVPEANVVIMAPGEPVTPEELVATSYFHINNRRRVVGFSGRMTWRRERRWQRDRTSTRMADGTACACTAARTEYGAW